MFNRQHMEEKITFSLLMRMLIFLVLIVPLPQGYGQTKVNANTVIFGTNEKTGLIGIGTYTPTKDSKIAEVLDDTNVLDKDESKYATLKAKTSALIVTKNGEAWIQTNFKDIIPANKTSYVKVSALTTDGGSLDLGKVVGGLLGLIGDKIFVDVYATSTSSTPIAANNVKITFVESGTGDLFLAINVSVPYQGVRIKLRSEGSGLNLLGSLNCEMKVYEAFYYTGSDSCGKPIATGIGSNGLNINLLGGLYGKREFAKSIDDDDDTFSTLKLDGLLSVGVAGSLSQFFYFTDSVDQKDHVRFIISSGAGLLNLKLLSGVPKRFWGMVRPSPTPR